LPGSKSDFGEIVDGHLRLKAARKLGISEIPVILCDEWSPAQVKAFRLLVNRSVNWADWDEELLALELQELKEFDYDLSLTGFDAKELDDLLLDVDEDKANAVPPVPDNPISRPGDLWVCGDSRIQHRLLCGDCTNAQDVSRLLGERTVARTNGEAGRIERRRPGLRCCGGGTEQGGGMSTAGQSRKAARAEARAAYLWIAIAA
jgi:hypothetical protein